MDDFLLKQTVLTLKPEPVPAEDVLRSLGMSDVIVKLEADNCLPPDISNDVALLATLAAIDEANRAVIDGLVVPRVVATTLPIASIADKGIFLDSIAENSSAFIPCSGLLFEGASHVMLAIATIGPLLERQVKAEFDTGDPLAGIVLDAMGTISLQRLASRIRQTCAQRADECGMETGPRIAPGCEAMPLDAQSALFSLLDADAIGVTLSDSLLMMPLKSTSLVLPLGPSLPDHLTRFNMCDTCPHKNRCANIIL